MKKVQSKQHRTIKYAITVQNVIFSLIGASIATILLLVLFTNPFIHQWAFFTFWGVLYVFLFGVLSYLQFWYYFSYRASLIYVSKVNNMLFSSSVYAALLIYTLSLVHTNQINVLTSIILALLFSLTYVFYQR